MSELLIKLWQNGILQLGIWETVYMTLISTFFAYLIGLPVGLILRMTDRDGIHPIGWLNRTLGIIVNALRNADENGLYNGVDYSSYQNIEKTVQVQVGSHQEDHGYYEDYVDYVYCGSCGARQ